VSTIPADLYAAVDPSVLGVGGTSLDVIGLVLTTNPRVPLGSVLSFPDEIEVEDYFGPGTEATLAGVYFEGFNGATTLPDKILFAQYNKTAVAAYLRGGQITLTLAQLQALTGSLTVVMDGYAHVISSINFASDNSPSAIAAAIQAAFTDPTEASFTAAIGATGLGTGSGTTLTMASTTGLISVGDSVGGDVGVPAGTVITALGTGTGGNGTYITNHPITSSGAPLTISSNILNVTADTDHTISAGQTLTGSGVTAGTLITGQLGGTTGGIGTYSINGAPQQVASESMTGVATAPLVTYDSVSGAFVVTSGITGTPSTAAFATGSLAASLNLTSATGAVLSQGAAPAVPAAFMNALVAVNRNWVTFMTAFDPDGGSGNTVKQAFAAWKNTQNNRFGYVCFDTDITPTENVPATGSLGYILTNNGDSGTCLIYEPTDLNLAAFICGAAASINFQQSNGRITFAYKNQAGLVASVTNATAAVNLGGNPQSKGGDRGNGYNYYGAVGGANSSFIWFQRGFCTGPFAWFDSYINQIWLNANLQNAALAFFGSINSVPFNAAGATLIEQALAAPIAAGLNFGAYAPGTITPAQIAAVNNAAGANIATTLQTQGWYLQVTQAPANIRASRGPWAITFFYLDRGSVQSLTIASVAVQ
jgi:Protein of unknown function (DUF3383)